MIAKGDTAGFWSEGRSARQQLGPAAMTQVMKAWDGLTEEEYLTWRVAANGRRRQGINYFKMVNLRRLLRGEELTRLPPQPKPFNPKPLLKRLCIHNRGGRITLKLQLHRAPTEPVTIWGSRPCNRGSAKPDRCPRLGWLRAGASLQHDITQLYFKKHREHLLRNQVPIVGKRIFIRLRRETDEGAMLYEQVQAVVPPPEGATRKKA
jgi:hypothetical protein